MVASATHRKDGKMARRLTEKQLEELRGILTEERDRLVLSGQADLEEAKPRAINLDAAAPIVTEILEDIRLQVI